MDSRNPGCQSIGRAAPKNTLPKC